MQGLHHEGFALGTSKPHSDVTVHCEPRNHTNMPIALRASQPHNGVTPCTLLTHKRDVKSKGPGPCNRNSNSKKCMQLDRLALCSESRSCRPTASGIKQHTNNNRMDAHQTPTPRQYTPGDWCCDIGQHLTTPEHLQLRSLPKVVVDTVCSAACSIQLEGCTTSTNHNCSFKNNSTTIQQAGQHAKELGRPDRLSTRPFS